MVMRALSHLFWPLAALAMLASSPVFANERAAIRWINRNAVQLATTDPEATDQDLAHVDAMIGEARILGAGEATHGSREFFRLKDRLFRHLVAAKGFTGLVIEANYADAERINAYVHGGPGDAEALIAGMDFWTWDTEEVLALVEWMRAYNMQHERQLSFYGSDIQFAPSNLAIALTFLEQAGVATAEWHAVLDPFVAQSTSIAAGYRATNGYDPARLRALREAAADMVASFDRDRTTLLAHTDRGAFERGRAAAIASAWYFVMQSRPVDWRFTAFRNEYDVRDRAMADLVEAALEREGSGGKLFVWAHNLHVTKARQLDGRMTMGRYLVEDAQPYVALGFAFDEGSFQAFPPANPGQPDMPPRLMEMRIDHAPPGSTEATLRHGPGPLWIADLRRLDPGRPAYAWFVGTRQLRWTGSDYSPALMAKHPPIVLTENFDLLAFVEHMTRARPLANTRRRQTIEKTW